MANKVRLLAKHYILGEIFPAGAIVDWPDDLPPSKATEPVAEAEIPRQGESESEDKKPEALTEPAAEPKPLPAYKAKA